MAEVKSFSAIDGIEAQALTSTEMDAIPLERESYLLQLGMTWQLTPRLFIEPVVFVGIGDTAPDMNFVLTMPYNF